MTRLPRLRPLAPLAPLLGVALSGCALLGLPPPGGANAELVEQLDTEVVALKEKNSLLLERLAVCDEDVGASAEVVRQLSQIFVDFEVTVERRGRLAVVVIPSALLFSENSLELRAESAPVLDLLGTALRLNPDEDILIVGFADAGPTRPSSLIRLYPSGWEWAAAQANSVRKALITGHGVSVTRIMVASRGDAAPRAVEGADPAANRAASRRVEIVFGATLP